MTTGYSSCDLAGDDYRRGPGSRQADMIAHAWSCRGNESTSVGRETSSLESDSVRVIQLKRSVLGSSFIGVRASWEPSGI